MKSKLVIAWMLAIACAAAHAAPPLFVNLPGSPFGVAASADGKWVFVAITNPPQIALLRHDNGQYTLFRQIPLDTGPTGIVLTHDGKLLIAAAGSAVDVLDVGRMISGSGKPVVFTFWDGPQSGSIYVNVTQDDKTLFVSEEGAQSITVIDLAHVRSSGFDAKAIIGTIPAGEAPIALTFSPDDRWLYTTSEAAPPLWGWADMQQQDGAVMVVDVARSRVDPAHSVVSRVPAGDSPVRMAISPDGRDIYVTARGANQVLAFDTAKLISDPSNARIGAIGVGPAPVPISCIQGGKILIVGNSNRFAADSNKPQTLSVIDASRLVVIGTIPSGAFPREMCVSADGKTLYVSNFLSAELEIIDAENLPLN